MCPINCPNRCAEPNCHNTCADYIEYIEKLKQKTEKINAEKARISEFRGFKVKKITCVPKDRR